MPVRKKSPRKVGRKVKGGDIFRGVLRANYDNLFFLGCQILQPLKREKPPIMAYFVMGPSVVRP